MISFFIKVMTVLSAIFLGIAALHIIYKSLLGLYHSRIPELNNHLMAIMLCGVVLCLLGMIINLVII